MVKVNVVEPVIFVLLLSAAEMEMVYVPAGVPPPVPPPQPSPAPTLRNTSITKATGHLFLRIPGMRSNRMQPTAVPPAAAIRPSVLDDLPAGPF